MLQKRRRLHGNATWKRRSQKCSDASNAAVLRCIQQGSFIRRVAGTRRRPVPKQQQHHCGEVIPRRRHQRRAAELGGLVDTRAFVQQQRHNVQIPVAGRNIECRLLIPPGVVDRSARYEEATALGEAAVCCGLVKLLRRISRHVGCGLRCAFAALRVVERAKRKENV